MKKAVVYFRHQAFINAYKTIKGFKKPVDGFERAKKYHHAPGKLKDFTSYTGYLNWANELYEASVKLISLLRKLYERTEKAKSSWYSNKKNLNSILVKLGRVKRSLNNLYDDI